MATRFYLHNAAAPYTPATIRGAWNSTGSAVTKLISEGHRSDGDTYVAIYPSGTAPYDALCYRGVSGALSAGTIGTGTVNLCVGVWEQNADQNAYWHLHIYVTQGDSDTVRGTLLTNYREDTTNEWPSGPVNRGTALQSAQSLSSVSVSAGDRLVVELGLVRRGSTEGWNNLIYGMDSGAVDLAVGESAYETRKVGWIEFSESFGTASTAAIRATRADVDATFAEVTAPVNVTRADVDTAFGENTAAASVTRGDLDVVLLDDANPARITQAVAEVVQAQTASARLTQLVVELMAPAVVSSRVTQMVAELLTLTTIESRHTQIVAELLDAQTRDLRLTQLVIEVLGKTSTYCGPPSLSPAPLCGKADVLAWLEWTVQRRSGGGGSVVPPVDETVVMPGGTDVPNLFEYSYTYTDPQIKAWPTTPIVVLPAPGSDCVWLIIAASVIVDSSGGAYGNIDHDSVISLVETSGNGMYFGSEFFVNNYTYGWHDVEVLLGMFGSTGKNLMVLANRWSGETWADLGTMTLADMQTDNWGNRDTTQIQLPSFANLAVGVKLDNQSAGDLTGGHSGNTLRTRTLALKLALS